MAIQTIATIKGWFMTGLKPLQQQFWDWLDSFRHVSVAITIDDLDESLQAVINSVSAGALKEVLTAAGTATFAMPAGSWLIAILFIDEGNPAISVGKTEGGQEIYPQEGLANGWAIQRGDMFFLAGATIYFNGITGNTIAKILYI